MRKNVVFDLLKLVTKQKKYATLNITTLPQIVCLKYWSLIHTGKSKYSYDHLEFSAFFIVLNVNSGCVLAMCAQMR